VGRCPTAQLAPKCAVTTVGGDATLGVTASFYCPRSVARLQPIAHNNQDLSFRGHRYVHFIACAQLGGCGTLTETIKCHVLGFFMLCFLSVLLVSVHKVVNGVASCWGLHKRSTLRAYKRKPLHVDMLVKAGSEVPRHPALFLIVALFFLGVLSWWT